MMANKKKYDEILKEVKADLQKLSNNEVGLNEAVALFETNIEKINLLKADLEQYKIKVQKVLDDNRIENFED